MSTSNENRQPITCWYHKNEKSEYEFNHIQDGHVPDSQTHPTPKTNAHKAWARGTWMSKKAWGDGSLTTKITLMED